MKNLSIRQKILLATIIPVLTLSVALMWIVYNSSQKSTETATSLVSYSTLENSKTALQNYVDIANSAIKPIYESAEANDKEAQQQALRIIQSISFDDGDGHIFIYKYDGMKLSSGDDAKEEQMLNQKDVNGQPIVKDMINIAQKGQGFYQYRWFDPIRESNEPKVSYVIGIEKWGWAIGSDIYLSHVNDDVEYLREEIEAEANKAFITELVVAIVIASITALLGTLVAKMIAKPIQDMSNIMTIVAEGDLTPRMEAYTSSDIGVFSNNFNCLLNKIHSILSSVTDNANELAAAASQLKQTSKSTYEAINEQDQETIAISSSIDEMSTSASDIAENGNDVKTAACDAKGKTQEISQVVEDNVLAVKSLADEITQAAGAISAVEKRTDEIQSMLEVIHSVTEQTNLLALNAAIEAARAGEQGRGFAVVADEVRSLAMRSAESAEEINRIIEGLIVDTKAAVNTMNHSRDSSEQSLERTHVVATSLTAINDSIQSILEKSAYIAQVTEEQNGTAQEISRNTSRIKNISTTSAERMKETKESSSQLDKLSKNLLKDINYFTLEGDTNDREQEDIMEDKKTA